VRPQVSLHQDEKVLFLPKCNVLFGRLPAHGLAKTQVQLQIVLIDSTPLFTT
jgi:hypothetical protein